VGMGRQRPEAEGARGQPEGDNRRYICRRPGRCREAVGERAEEGDNQVFFVIAETELPARHVHVVLDFGLGPAGHLFDGSRRAMSGLDGVSENIPRVIEMDEFLQALHIAIMKERLLEGGTIGRRHRRIARRRYLHLAVDARRILDPLAVRVDAGKAPEEQAHAQIIEAKAPAGLGVYWKASGCVS
jgi:hypothetical protein